MSDTLSVELEIKEDKATVKIDRFTQSLHRLNADINSVGKNAPFAEKLTTDFDALEKKTNDVRTAFQSVSKTRLDLGNIGFLTKEIVKTSERARQLQSDIGNIKRELANPARKSSIAFLTEELKAAETEADRLNRKLDTVNARNSTNRTSGKKSGGTGGKRGRITDLQATALELADDFAPEGFNRPFNAAARGLIGINALSLTTVATFGAIAAAGVAVVKVTQNIREEAERRLKYEEQIQGAINNQYISQKKALDDLAQARKEAEYNRNFQRDLQTNSVDQLKQRRATAEQIYNLSPTGEGAARLKQEILAFEAQINEIQQRNKASAAASFNQRFENFKKNQQDAIEFEQRQAEKAKIATEKKEKDIEKAKQKIADFGKTANSFFDDLFQKSNKDNPFASILSESDKAAKDLKETLRGLSPELQAVAEKLQQKLNANSLFNARLDTALDAFDLRDQAEKFRSNPLKDDLRKFNANPAKSFNDFIEFQLKKLQTDFLKNGGGQTQFNRVTNADGSFGGFSQSREDPFTRYHSNIFKGTDGKQYTNGFSQSDARNDLLYFYERTGGFSESSGGKGFGNNLGGFFRRDKTFADLTAAEKGQYLADVNKTDANSNLSLQTRLEKQLGIVDLLSKNGTDEQASIANRKIIALTQGIDPRSLNESQRDRVALAREKEADRLGKVEEEAKKERDADRKIREKLNEVLEKLANAAEKGGTAAVDVYIKNDTDAKTELKPAASAKDVQKAYDDAYTGGTFFDDYNKR